MEELHFPPQDLSSSDKIDVPPMAPTTSKPTQPPVAPVAAVAAPVVKDSGVC